MAVAHPIPSHPNFKDRTGQTFERLSVVSYAGKNKHGHSLWNCLCECGKECVVPMPAIKTGNTRSCGCLKNGGESRRLWKHGGCGSAEYFVWVEMRCRCSNTLHRNWMHYGGRGITVCERWQSSFANFITDMGERPSSQHSLDRYPDNNGNYEPGNCRWATQTQQTRNCRKNRILTLNGESHCIAEWAELLQIPAGRIHNRLRLGWPDERALQQGKVKWAARKTT